MNKDDFQFEYGQTYDDYEAEDYSSKIFFGLKITALIAAVAAVLFILVFIIATSVRRSVNTVKLSPASTGVSVKYIKQVPNGLTAAANLQSLSEADLLKQPDTSIIKGQVVQIKNISIQFKNMSEYRAVAEIKVAKVYRGECSEGDIISVMLPFAIGENVWSEDNNTISKMSTDMNGIFILHKYNEEYSLKANGATLLLRDVADYGFPDGRRYAFLESKDGLIFSKDSYPSISGAASLDEIENFILSFIQ